MNPDRLTVFVPGTDPAAQRWPCGCRGVGRGAHQVGCWLRGRGQDLLWLRWALGIGWSEAADVLAEMRSEER